MSKQLKDKSGNNIFPNVETAIGKITKVNNSNADLYSGQVYKIGNMVVAKLDFTITTPNVTNSYKLGTLPEGFVPSSTARFDVPQSLNGITEDCRIYFWKDGGFGVRGGVAKQTYITLTYLL